MTVTASSIDTRCAVRAWISAAALCCVVAVSLSGCVAAKVTGNTLPSAIQISTGGENSREEFSLRIPDDWNGQVVLLLRGAVAYLPVRAQSSSVESAASALLDRRFAVATPAGSTDGAAGISASGERLNIHFALGFGSPARFYLFGMSKGEYVALATVEKNAGELDRTLVYALDGFVHVSFFELQDARTIGLALRADEPMAVLLSYRLGIDRVDLTDTLGFFYALLTGTRNSLDRAWGGLRTIHVNPGDTGLARQTRSTGGFQ